jgi:hypothetical protein
MAEDKGVRSLDRLWTGCRNLSKACDAQDGFTICSDRLGMPLPLVDSPT